MRDLRARARKVFACIVYFSTFIPAAAAAPEQSLTLAEPRWSSTPAEVKEKEARAPKSERSSGDLTYLVFDGEMLGRPVSVVYRFIHDALFEITYSFEASKKSCAELLGTFDQIVRELTRTKGTSPAVDTPAASNGCNRDASWDSKGALTSVRLSSDSGRNDLTVSLRSGSLERQAEQVTIKSGGATVIERH